MNVKAYCIINKNTMSIVRRTLTFFIVCVVVAAAGTPFSPTIHRGERLVASDAMAQMALIRTTDGEYCIERRCGQHTVRSAFKPFEILVKYRPLYSPSAIKHALLSVVGDDCAAYTEVEHELSIVKIAVKGEANFLSVLRIINGMESVLFAEPNYIITPDLSAGEVTRTPDDPKFGEQWGPNFIEVPMAWELVPEEKRKSVVIGNIDVGVDIDHEDLKDMLLPGYNFVDNNENVDADHYHGSHTSGIAAAVTNNKLGIAGVCGGAKVLPVKVMNAKGGTEEMLLRGVKFAVDKKVNLLSMSLSTKGTSQIIQEAVTYAVQKGVPVIASTGNNNGPINSPANCEGALAVGNVDDKGVKATTSNFGPQIWCTAPGENVISCSLNNSYEKRSGTSMAVPHVSGTVALMVAIKPDLTIQQIKDIFKATSTDKGDAGFDELYGWGIINTQKAVREVLKTTITAPEMEHHTISFQLFNRLTLTMIVTQPQRLAVSVYSLDGRTVVSRALRYYTSGTYSIQCLGDRTRSSVWAIRVESQTGVQTYKAMVVR